MNKTDGTVQALYEPANTKHRIPLSLGIGATQIDRNSIAEFSFELSETIVAATFRYGGLTC
ncbi:MAG: hypothetical protein GY820_48020 [Gammaproteobacteria bacterium]|nr:hypothetical protein [Gammaproteobacteria bacterium]